MKRKLFKKGEIIQHFKSEMEGRKKLYIVIDYGKDTESLKDVAIYKSLIDGQVWVRPLSEFMGKVDKEKYPEIKQKHRFEKIRIGR